MKTKEEIKQHFESEFSSSPCAIDETELDTLIAQGGECINCGCDLLECYDFPVLRDEGYICERCEMDKYYETCPICQNSFEKAFKAEDYNLLISKEAVEEYQFGIKPGFYKTLSWPYYFGNCVTGFDGLFENELQLVHECDINSMLKNLDHGSADENLNGEVCEDCLGIWTGKTEIINNYCDKEYGAQYIAKQKEAIKNGF